MHADYFRVPETLEELCKETISFHSEEYARMPERIIRNRESLSEYARIFHENAGTLSPEICRTLENMAEGDCILLMSAHQPNCFPYSGVMRKISVLDALGDEIGINGKNYAEFFGIGDQDIAESWRWQRETQIPNIEKKKGYQSLFCNVPEEYSKKIYCSVPKPSLQEKEMWKKDLKNWLEENLTCIEKNGFAIPEEKKTKLNDEYSKFSGIVDMVYERAESLADFNSFLMSEIANFSWKNDTSFARFSEFEEIFGNEFSRLLYRNGEYQKHMREAMMKVEGKVPIEKAPFWYHCECNGKVGLDVETYGSETSVSGKCPCCGKEHEFSFANEELRSGEGIEEINGRVSPRARAMPLIFMDGLGVACYVGGSGGSMKYSAESRMVADKMGVPFPVYTTWLPVDCYSGVGQLNAFTSSGKYSSIPDVEESLDEIQKKISEVEKKSREEKENAMEIRNNTDISDRMTEINRKFSGEKKFLLSQAARMRKIPGSLKIRPSIADYAINIGIEKIGDEWKRCIRENGFSEKYIKIESIIGADDEIRNFLMHEMEK